jgi:hypoxanthine phosphoribosyltransferase
MPKRPQKSAARRRPARGGGKAAPARRAQPPGERKRKPRRPSGPRAEQPLGVGVGDAYAVERLAVPPDTRRAPGAAREMGWAEFGDVARGLADRIGAEFRPHVVLGIVNGGVFLGGALAAALEAEFRPLRVRKFRRRSVSDAVTGVRGKRVLVVDDVTVSGQTMTAARTSVARAGAAEVRTAALVSRPGRHRPDYGALETDEVVVFGWDYQLHGDGGEPGTDPGEVGV